MMKRLLTILLAALMVFSLAACGGELPPLTLDPPPEPPAPPTPSAPPDPPREVIKVITYVNGFTLILDEETELTTQLKILVNGFLFPLLPEDEITVTARTLIGIYNDFKIEGLIESVTRTQEEFLAFYEKYGWETILEVENLDIVFDYIFSENAENITTNWHEHIIEDGLVGFSAFGITGGYRLILKEQFVSEELVELYFYYIYNDGNFFMVSESNSEKIGDIGDSYITIYEDLLDTLGIVKYTFVLEDGKYKILSIT